ncbi:MAG: hypothetical protein ACI9E1_000157 [Cryomorphaceae bacterium]|jgi:hypothetical protein
MSENPYQTPESMPVLADAQEEDGDFSLLRSTSFWGILSFLSIGADVIFTAFALFDISYVTYFDTRMTIRMSIFFVIILAVCIWTSKSMTNAWVGGKPTPTITPASSVYYYFTPILWFWKPYVMMKQIWDNLFWEKSSKALIRAWWYFWLLGFWGIVIMTVLSTNRILDIDVIYFDGVIFCKIVSGILFMTIISKITMGHNKRIAGARN